MSFDPSCSYDKGLDVEVKCVRPDQVTMRRQNRLGQRSRVQLLLLAAQLQVTVVALIDEKPHLGKYMRIEGSIGMELLKRREGEGTIGGSPSGNKHAELDSLLPVIKPVHLNGDGSLLMHATISTRVPLPLHTPWLHDPEFPTKVLSCITAPS